MGKQSYSTLGGSGMRGQGVTSPSDAVATRAETRLEGASHVHVREDILSGGSRSELESWWNRRGLARRHGAWGALGGPEGQWGP